MKPLILLSTLFCLSIFSQSISKQIISASGESFNNANANISFTIGETIVGLMTSQNGILQLGSGFHPAFQMELLSIDEDLLNDQIQIFPNPTNELLNISSYNLGLLSVKVTNLNGKIIYSGSILNNSTVDFSSFSKGVYLLIIEENNTNNKSTTYKIIKN